MHTDPTPADPHHFESSTILTNSSYMLECTAVSKTYGTLPILQIASLQLEKGIYCLRGTNGSGKTTFLRMVAGLLPFQGSIVLDGYDLHKNPLEYRRLVSWSDAEPLYPAFLSGQELIALYQDIRKATPEQIDRLIKVFRVQPYISAPVSTYSSGMTKRLSLLLAFIGSPSLIVLDEPLVTLDREAIPALYDLITESWLETKTGFLISSHQDLDANALPTEKELLVANHTILPV